MKKVLSCFLVLLIIFCSGFANLGTEKKTGIIPHELAPMNRDAIVNMLIKEGKLSSDATQEEVEKALKDYMGNVSVRKETTKLSKMRETIYEEKIEEGIENINSLYNGKKLGYTGKNILDPAKEVSYGTPLKTGKVLVLLVEFPDMKHNEIPKPDNLKSQYWTKDFNADHYRKLIFGDTEYTTPEGTKSPSMNVYFKDQSNGNFAVTGDVYGWFTASKPAAYYGEDINGRGDDQAPRELVIETVNKAAAAGVDFSKYDYEDPYDLDGDGNINEPDGMVDHLMIIHSGVGQEDDGGNLGTNAIWSHRWNLENPTQIASKKKSSYYAYDYTMEPENGAVGVMAHEFTHDLGMPDDYDTEYTADGDIVEYWSIMGSGSWCGEPGGTQPSGINPYSRIQLGLIHGGSWINAGSIDLNDFSGTINAKLDTASMNTGRTQAILFKLPEQNITVNKPFEGTNEFWGGNGSEADHTMTMKVDLTGKTSANLTYNIWYDIEKNWDAGMIQVSEDGTTWRSIKTPYTVDDFNNSDAYPTILANFPAYTGSSNGWLNENIDLSSYAGKPIYLRFRYITDWGTELDGMFVDNIKVTADDTQIAYENAENGYGNLVSNGFLTSTGTKTGEHYYVAEWRSHLGVDEGLMHCAMADVAYNQGLLLWYKNTLYDNNWVGVHPGYGTLGVVDANQYVYINAGLGNGNEYGSWAGYMPFVQLHDAAFSLDKASDMDLSAYDWALTPNLEGKQAVPAFDDSNAYINFKSPYSGLFLPKYGLQIRVTGRALDYSTGEIVINK